jgi:hypothetical protein
MGATRLETSVSNYHTTLRNIPEERRSQIMYLPSFDFNTEIKLTWLHYIKFYLFLVAHNTVCYCSINSYRNSLFIDAQQHKRLKYDLYKQLMCWKCWCDCHVKFTWLSLTSSACSSRCNSYISKELQFLPFKRKTLHVQTIKIHAGVEVWLPHILNLGKTWEWVFSLTLELLFSGGKRPCYSLNKKLEKTQTWCVRFGTEIGLLPLPGMEPRVLGCPASLSRIFYRREFTEIVSAIWHSASLNISKRLSETCPDPDYFTEPIKKLVYKLHLRNAYVIECWLRCLRATKLCNGVMHTARTHDLTFVCPKFLNDPCIIDRYLKHLTGFLHVAYPIIQSITLLFTWS